MNYFNKKKDLALIELVKCNTVLYDTTHKHYKNNYFKHKVWEDISEALKIPVSEVKKHWKHFRDHYLKKSKAAATGKGRGSWKYMTELSFLAPYTIAKEEMSEEDEAEDWANGDQSHESMPESERSFKNSPPTPDFLDINIVNTPQDMESFNMPPTKRRKSEKNSHASILERKDERAPMYEKLLTEPQKSPIHKFFESMADIVSDFPPHLAAEARLRVCQVVNEIEMKKHNAQ